MNARVDWMEVSPFIYESFEFLKLILEVANDLSLRSCREFQVFNYVFKSFKQTSTMIPSECQLKKKVGKEIHNMICLKLQVPK